ncbi:MAG: SMC-Scp complex subunit ScpB, partial [Bacteroidetes bacterium]|nr:SMC-Scp complex subunit ScpB [Bacteroidota bacterium]
DSFQIGVSVKEVEDSINELNEDYEKGGNAFEIIKVAGGFQYATRKKFAHFLGKLTAETQKKKLSQSAIETLAIIAYKQPITRSEIEFVRGVNVDYIVNSLLERDLISIKGRADGPGRPILYGTTTNFLKVLGLNAIEDLPKLKEINEILKNEKIDGITEADIDLFNSMSLQAEEKAAGTTNEQPKLFDENGGEVISDETAEEEVSEDIPAEDEEAELQNNVEEITSLQDEISGVTSGQEETSEENSEDTPKNNDEENRDGDGKKE